VDCSRAAETAEGRVEAISTFAVTRSLKRLTK
jgi:hypothetical protein